MLREIHIANGAALANDGIPLHYGDLKAEYHAALKNAILLDRSHEGRLLLEGRDHIALMQRMSTNDLEGMNDGEGRATIFTNPNGRILDRALVYKRGDTGLVITEPSRNEPFLAYLQRHIFFNDHVTARNITVETAQFALHGPAADQVIAALLPDAPALAPMHGKTGIIGGTEIFAARNKAISGTHWIITVGTEGAEAVYSAILEAGRAYGLVPAGGLTYNTLCVRAGRPMLNRELSQEHIPLEIGLWDEVSFTKGCYTGQEIIARMESRNRLAKTLVRLTLAAQTAVPVEIVADDKRIGLLTSCITTPDGEILGLGLLKPQFAHAGQRCKVGADGIHARVIAPAGVQPAQLASEENG